VAYQLNSELQRGRYSDAFFTRITGKKLDELWADFQKIPAFKPGAAEAFALYQTRGFGGAEPPKDALKRFKKYVDQHADDFTKHALKLSIVDGKEIKDVRILITEYLYFTQPGGSAEKAWLDLHKKSGMPGILEGEKGWMDTYFRYDEISSQKYPQSRTFQVRKRNDATSTYHYTMVRASVDSGWKLAKAWRAGTDGKTIEEFPVP
jgi:hypothetical protein